MISTKALPYRIVTEERGYQVSLWDVVGLVVTLLILAHMLIGYLRFVGIVMFADGGGLPGNKWLILFAQMLFWLAADLKERWVKARQRRRIGQHTGLE